MKSSIIEKAKKIIENKHYEAEREALNNKEEALKDPEFKKLYLAYINNIIESAKTGEENPEEEKKLKKAVEQEYYCQKCKDNGLTKDGKYCDCFIDEINKLLKAESGFLELEDFKNTNLDIFEANSMRGFFNAHHLFKSRMGVLPEADLPHGQKGLLMIAHL